MILPMILLKPWCRGRPLLKADDEKITDSKWQLTSKTTEPIFVRFLKKMDCRRKVKLLVSELFWSWLAVNKTILKPRVAAEMTRQYVYVGFSRRNKIPHSNAYTISEKAIRFWHPDYNLDQAQKLISSSMSRHLLTRNISSKSMHAFFNNLANRQTDRQRRAKTFTSSFVWGKSYGLDELNGFWWLIFYSDDLRLPASSVCCTAYSTGGSHWSSWLRQIHTGCLARWQVQSRRW